jgi:hypothetical protein
MKRLFSSPYHLSPWPDLFRPPTSFAKYSAEHKKSWMPTELVRGLKAHGTSPATGHRSRAVNEIVPADRLLARAREIAGGLAKLPPLTSSYTRIALTQKLRRIIDEGVGYGLALEGISAADVARSQAR